jgi:hypothetical protein
MRTLLATYGCLGEEEDRRVWGAEGYIERPLDLIAWLAGPGFA